MWTPGPFSVCTGNLNSVEDLPECLASYYVEQSRVFAKKILMLAPQLRSTLLAEHTHGVTKVVVW